MLRKRPLNLLLDNLAVGPQRLQQSLGIVQTGASLIELGLRPAERFAAEWLDGMLDLPVQVCSAEQLFGVYVRWCRENGERDWRGQAMFTRTVERFVRERVKLDERGKQIGRAHV